MLNNIQLEKELGKNGMKVSPRLPLLHISHLPIPYHGNKKKLLSAIDQILDETEINFTGILDAFSGSSVVSLFFKKMGKHVVANDLLKSSATVNNALVTNSKHFLSDAELDFLIYSKSANNNIHFVEQHYLGHEFQTKNPKTKFNRFTPKECEDLDRIRSNIDYLENYHKKCLALACVFAVVFRLPFGTVDQSTSVLKHRKRQAKEYGQKDRRIGIYYDEDYNLKFDKWIRKYADDFAKYGICNSGKLAATLNLDAERALQLVEEKQINAVYLDPPYGGKTADYASLYRFFEEYTILKPLESMSHIQRYANKFVNYESYYDNFLSLLKAARKYPIWILSYNNNSWRSVDDIVSIIKEFRSQVSVIVLEKDYRYRYREKSGKNRRGTEFLIIARV